MNTVVHHSFEVFYRDYVNSVTISSTAPEPLSADRVAPLAEALLQHADNFLGIVDKEGVTLQAYLDDDEQSVFLELLYPDTDGVMRLQLPWADALELLGSLPATFDDPLLPGARWIAG